MKNLTPVCNFCVLHIKQRHLLLAVSKPAWKLHKNYVYVAKILSKEVFCLLTLHLCSSQFHLIILCFQSLVIRLEVAIFCLDSLICREQRPEQIIYSESGGD